MASNPRKPLSEKMARALGIIARHERKLLPSDFSRLMWDTSSWSKNTLGQTGAAYIWRLWWMGLVWEGDSLSGVGPSLTEAGREALRTGTYVPKKQHAMEKT